MISVSIPVKPTRVILVLIIVLHLLAALAVLLLSLSEWFKMTGVLILLSHGVWQGYRYQKQFSVCKIGFNPSGFWCEAEQPHWVKVLPGSIITRLFISLHLQSTDTNKRFYLFLPVWHYAPMEYRALARQLRS